MNLLLLLIGIIMEPLPVMIIFVPVFLPVAVAFGIDPVHFGATAVVNVMIGMLTRPSACCSSSSRASAASA